MRKRKLKKGKIKILKVILFTVLTIIIFKTENAWAGEYYVAPRSSAQENITDEGVVAWQNATNINNPCSAKTAMTHAVAGDIVYFRGGTYDLNSSSIPSSGESGYMAILQPSNSGTEGNQIVFKSYENEVPLLNGHVIIKVTGVANVGTDNNHLVDNDVNFEDLGVVNWNIFRTVDKEGGAAIESASAHEVIFQGGPHNSLDNLSAGDAYEISYRFITTPIGVWRQEHITIDGFKIQSDGGVNAARIIMSNHSVNFNGKGLIVKNCEVYGGDRNIVHGDNREGIRIERTEGAIVSNCKVHGFNSMANNHNTGAFKTYDNKNLLFENNEIYDSTGGMYIKRRTNGGIIRNNYIHDNYSGIIITSYISAEYSSERNLFIYNNVITYSDGATIDDTVQESSDSDNMHIYNNTLYTGSAKSASVNFGPGRKYFYNNILVGQPRDYDIGHLRFTSNNPANNGVSVRLMESDHNLFNPLDSSNGLLIKTVNYDELNERLVTNYWSIADWQLSGELENGGNPGNGSFIADPLFVNTSGTMSQLADFTLSSNSPSKGAGRDGVDMGANICAVGINPSCGTTPDTTPPTLTNPQPTTTLPPGTTSTTLSITTNENSTCKYTTTANTPYNSITSNPPTSGTFTTTGTTTHSTTITGLTNGSSYNYYLRCSDTTGNVNTTDTTITFSISNQTYNLSNFTSLVTNWLGIGDSNSDINNDGVVNTRDLGIMMSSWE